MEYGGSDGARAPEADDESSWHGFHAAPVLALPHRAAPEGDVPQLGGNESQEHQESKRWNNSPRAPGKYFSLHAVLSNSMYHRHCFDLKCSLLLSCLPCLFGVFLP